MLNNTQNLDTYLLTLSHTTQIIKLILDWAALCYTSTDLSHKNFLSKLEIDPHSVNCSWTFD